MRRLAARFLLPALALLPVACSGAPDSEVRQKPLVARYVRVFLRSLGDWDKLTIRSRGGVWVESERHDSFVLRRDEPRKLLIRPVSGIIEVDQRAYSGDLLFKQGKLINNVALENYVLGVLRGELPLEDVPESAAAALAIAVRSYTLHYVAQHKPDFDLDDTTLYQVYVGLRYAPDDDALRAGVLATTGRYLTYGGKPLKAYYHSTCGGHTTDVPTGLDRDPIAPMSGVPCDYCRQSKYFRWKTTVTEAALLAAAGLHGPLQKVSVAERGPGERARSLLVEAGGESRTVKANAFRTRLGPSTLRSTRILALRRTAGGVLFEGGGWGHGVGLCQMGAMGLGRLKWSAQRIVSYYYPGASQR